MRMLVFFDLPVQTVSQRREYTRFRKFLMLVITETQYNSMEFIVGQKHGDIIDTDERLVIL